jgi:hypothetical protein
MAVQEWTLHPMAYICVLEFTAAPPLHFQCLTLSLNYHYQSLKIDAAQWSHSDGGLKCVSS